MKLDQEDVQTIGFLVLVVAITVGVWVELGFGWGLVAFGSSGLIGRKLMN